MKIGILCSRIRVEEKLIFDNLRQRGIAFDKIDDREMNLSLTPEPPEFLKQYDVILERCINHSRALYSLCLFQDWNIKAVNDYSSARICGDKLLTTSALVAHDVAIPETRVAYTPESALEAIEEMGYPVVLKPCVGSWGRLVSKINDRNAAEAVLEHKQILGSYHHSIYYIQEYINKPQRDLRVFAIGGEIIGAIYRTSDHWLTNTALGAKASNCELNDDLIAISKKASKAVGDGVVAIDLVESDDGYLVIEVNYTMEFRNSIAVTGVNIPEKIIDYVVKVANNG